MRKLILLSLSAGLTLAGVGAAAASDESVWRWQVSNCLHAQQQTSDTARVYREAYASDLTYSGANQRTEPLLSGEPRNAAPAQHIGQ